MNKLKSLSFITTAVAAVMFSSSARADEGMWLLPLLKQQNIETMQAMGLRLTAEDIYNPNGASLKDAVVIFGGGCTGEVVSPDGLVLTNHHCGYSSIQQHSSLEHDYLTDGFWAMSKEEELPTPGLTVSFIDKIEDVTAYVKDKLKQGGDSIESLFLTTRYLNELARERVGGEEYLKTQPGLRVEIRAFYGGNQYYMFWRKTYSDIRFVGAPPSSIGKFGADTDNWEWPRHTGDFSLFRIYADKDGNPADYSEDNVPLKPKRWLKISADGLNEGDFAMMIGFPGRTNKYYTSWEVAERRDIDNTVRIRVRDLRQQAMLDEMLNDPAIRIQYASKYASSTNAYKNAIGSNWAIKGNNLEAVKKETQDKLIAWAKVNNRPEYPEALRMLEQLVSDRKSLRFRSWMIDEAISRGIEFSSAPSDVKDVIAALKSGDKAAREHQLNQLSAAWQRFFNKNYSPEVDKRIAKIMLEEYLSQIPQGQRPEYFSVIDKKFKGDAEKFVDNIFAKSIFGSEANFSAFLAHPTAKALEQDPMILFAKSVRDERLALSRALADLDAGYAEAHRDYVKGLLEMNVGQPSFPDANSTIRITYGRKLGYHPKDAVYYEPQSTLDGVMQKEDPDNWEFVVPAKLKELYKAKDFGRYAMSDGRMPVALLVNTHSTGGNSGSPVMNAEGELVGINFDRNWEGVGGDIQYLPQYQRSIIVDIRYVLFVIDKYAGAGYLVKEMGL